MEISLAKNTLRRKTDPENNGSSAASNKSEEQLWLQIGSPELLLQSQTHREPNTLKQ